uniref:Methyltransferase FkbM domain-containing protein n=1 Tax=Scylla olivacea TaxID=85551 RepID=A0A0N7ZDK1_SCYOL
MSAARGDTWPFIHHYIKRLFSGETDGFFVEAGALDGQVLSNTLWLERECGWRGLLVEPDPFSYSCLLTKHRKAWTSNTCLSPSGLTNTSVHVSLSLAPMFTSPRWYMKGASHELGVTMRNPSYDNYLNSGVKSFSLVSCFPLATYLRALNVTVVDLLSLDTQGSEISIIKTFPWEKVHVRAVVVEVAAPEFQHDFVEYMRGRGFTLVGHYNDYIFVQEGDAALARLKAQDGWYVVVQEK